jgi:predicted branched-subunit amino acid permease
VTASTAATVRGSSRCWSVPLDAPEPTQTITSPSRQALADVAPLVLGYLPFGLVFGATVAASPVSDLAGLASSPIVYAGASQLAMVELLTRGAAPVVIVLTVLVINLRHVMYSGALAVWFREEPLRWRLLAPYLLVDPVYTFSVVRFPQLGDAAARRRYYVTLGLALLANWTAMTAAGVLLGAQLPESVPFELAVPLVFLALLVPMVVDLPTLAAAVAGGVVTIAAADAPLHLGIVIGSVAGVGAGMLLDTYARDHRPGAIAPGDHADAPAATREGEPS